jgi:heavy metal translocating P-type ATPase
MLKKLSHFFKEYRELGFVIVAFVVGLVLDIAGWHAAAHTILGGSALIATGPLLWEMVKTLRGGEYGIDLLAATAIITSVILHEYWAAMIIVLMLTGGEALEDYAEARAKVELSSLLERKPKQAHLLKGRKTIDVAVDSIHKGDKLIIKPGEVVPVDAVILEGSASFDESSLTGESLPVDKNVGDEILSGSINVDSVVTVRALRPEAESQFEQIVKLVRSAASSQSPFVRLADRYSIPFTVVAFIIAGGAWAMSGQAIRFLEVLVVATPCPLLLGAPIALISGMSRAAKNGIIIKTGSALERLAEVRTIGFDKTGTLTQGQPTVAGITTYNGFDKDEVLVLAASLEQNSNHVLARAILDAAAKAKLKLSKVKHIREEAGLGLSGHLHGHEVTVGRYSLLMKRGVSVPTSAQAKQTAAYITVDNKLAGVITFIDPTREEAKGTLQRLKNLGIKHFLMVTGDNQATANAVAKQLGINQVEAECLPADKLRAVDKIKDRPVAFVGDGVNDAPVLTAADVGIALGARGSTAASESADVVILLDDLSRVATSVQIAKRTFFIAKQSILIGIFISVGLMFIFSTGHFKPVYGAAIQELVDVAVIFNALRAHGPWRAQAHAPPQLAD